MRQHIRYSFPLLAQTIALLSYILILIFKYHGDRKLFYFPVILSTTLLLDYVLKKMFRNQQPAISLSVVISSSACYLLLSTDRILWPYLISSYIAVLGKYLFKFQGRHLFNPANLGVFVVTCLFSEFAMINLGQWFSEPETTGFFILVGIIVAIAGKRIVLSLSYISLFIVLRLMKSMYAGMSLSFTVGPLLNIASFLFVFHMITDPQTTPSKKSQQVVFGFMVAILDYVFRDMQIAFSPLLSLLVVCSLTPIFFPKKVEGAP